MINALAPVASAIARRASSTSCDTRSLGLVIPDIANGFFTALTHALEDAAFSEGRLLIIGDSANSGDREREIVQDFIQRGVEGLLHIGVDDRCDQLAEVAARGIPVVALDRACQADGIASVTADNAEAAARATEHLISHGHRSIALIGGPSSLSTARARRTGWRRAMREAGLPVRSEWMLAGPFTRAKGLELGRALFAQRERPSAVFVCCDQQAIGVLRAANESGIQVPHDLAVIAFDGSEDAAFTTPALTTAGQPVGAIARAAIELLIHGPRDDALHLTCAADLVIRRSCGCPED